MMMRALNGTCIRILALASAVLLGMPAQAQEEVIEQTNDGEGSYWFPAVTAFYAQPEQTHPVFPEGDGPPTFADENRIKPPFRFSLNQPPVDKAPTIDTDWLVLSKNFEEGDAASAWFLARKNGKPRLYIHRCHETEYMAGYVKSVRLYIVLELGVPREALPIPGKPPRGPERDKLIRDNIRIVSGKIEITEWNDVSASGRYGKLASETPLATTNLADWTISNFGNRPKFEFIPRGETVPKGDRFDGIVQVSFELELEADTKLGLPAPQRKKLKGAIRFAIGEQYVNIGVLGKD
jgi:hypothetical protein